MSSTAYPDVSTDLTAGGGTTGTLTVTSTVGFKERAVAYLSGDGGTQRCLVRTVLTSTTMVVVFLPEGIDDPKLRSGVVKYPSMQGSNCAAWLTGSRISQASQLVADVVL